MPVQKLLQENPAAFDFYQLICNNALKVLCRLITSRESDDKFHETEKMSKIIYENYAITVPMIFDMLSLYGHSNKNLMKKFIDTTIKLESKYLQDLKLGLKFILDAFSKLQARLDEIDQSSQNLYDDYEDAALYLINITTTLRLLLELLPLDKMKIKDLQIESRISGFYDLFIPNLYGRSYEVDPNSNFLCYINFARVELISCFHNFVTDAIANVLNSSDAKRQKCVDEAFHILIENAGYKTFIQDYVLSHPIDADLDVLTQFGSIDKIKLNYVVTAYQCEPRRANAAAKEVEINDDFEGACALPLPIENEKSKDLSPDGDIQIETTKILEIFPHLGTGYIRTLLIFYDNKSETVISKILEGKLDEMFANADESETYIPPETPTIIKSIKDIIKPGECRDLIASINSSEFKADVKLKGKFLTKSEPRTYHELLNDKSSVNRMKDRYSTYNMVSEVTEEAREYDDEYDDSYEDFAFSERKVPVNLNVKMREMLPDNDENLENESDEDEQERPKNNDFCENPEVIRARREQQFRNRMAKKGRGGAAPAPAAAAAAPAPRDVVGNEKGKGQSDDVLRNRANKNTNKSSRANHNRKAGSNFKQSRGMY